MYNIPRYQTGSYIPGLESQIFGAKLDRSIADTQEDLRNKSKKMQKGFLRGKIGKFLGKNAGKWLGSALTKGIAATNPLMALAIKAAISSGTQRFGEKLLRGKDVNLNNKSGLLGSQYEDLDEYQKGIDKSARGAAWETFGDEIIGGLKSDYGKQIWGDQLSDDFKTKVFGENIASKSHEELSKMNIGEMLGAAGTEEKLSDIGERAYEWAGDKGLNTYKWLGDRGLNTYKGIGNIYKGARDFPTDLYGGASDLYRGASDLYKGIKGENLFTYQKGGEVQGYQEGGSADYVNMDDVIKRKMLMERFGNVFNQELDVEDRIRNFTKAKMAMDKSSGLWTDFEELNGGYRASGGKGNLTNEEYSTGMRNLQSEKNMLLNMLKSSLKSRQPEGMQEGGMAYPLQMAGGGYMPEQGFGGLIQYRKGY